MSELEALEKDFLDTFRGNSLLGDLEILHKFATDKENIVELGTAFGMGTLILLGGVKGMVTTIDNHKFYREFPNQKMICPAEEKHRIISEYLTFVSRGKIRTILNDTVAEARNWNDDTVDMLFIDGGHSYEQVKEDWKSWFPKVKHDCPIVLHDVREECCGVWDFWCNDMVEILAQGLVKELVQTPKFQTVCKVVVKV